MARPKGSRNKRSVGIPPEISKALGYRRAYDVIGEFYSMDHEELKRLVRGAAGARAVAIRIQAAIAALPYENSKMPVKQEIQIDQLPSLIIRSDVNSLQNQSLIKSLVFPVVQGEVVQDIQLIETIGKNND